MKISVFSVTVKGRRKFMVSHGRGSERSRRIFKTKSEAEAHAEEINLQKQQAGEVWLSLSAQERNHLISVYKKASDRGVELEAALDAYQNRPVIRKTVAEAYTDFILEKKRQRLSKRSILEFSSNVGRFKNTCAQRQLAEITRKDVLDWVGQWQNRTFNAYLASVNSFFKWCVTVGHLVSNPCASIPKISSRRMGDLDKEPAILTPEQAKALLKSTRETDPNLVPYVALCLFGGLRPEREAARMTWTDVTAHVLVRGLHAKDRQRRYVSITPNLRLWLDLGGDLPVKNLRRRFEAVRRAAGLFETWEQDCMRHSFGSYHLVKFGLENTIASMGHGDYDMLFRHYRTLVSAEQAEAFWSIVPD